MERSRFARTKTILHCYKTHVSVKKPYLHAHWRIDPIIHTTYAKSTGLSHDKFMDILTKLHLNGNENHVARGKPRL
jgi:hypothetical protein